MKTFFYILALVFTLTSCSKSEIEDLDQLKINLPNVKNIEWKRYDPKQLCTLEFMNDTIFMFTRTNYTDVNISNPGYYMYKEFGQYYLKYDSVILKYNVTFDGKVYIPKKQFPTERYSLKVNSDSLVLYLHDHATQIYYSQKKHGSY
jgi:hypothetical protein